MDTSTTGVTKRALFVTASELPWGAERSLRLIMGAAPDDWSCSLLASSLEVADFCRPSAREILLVPARLGKMRILTSFAKELLAVGEQFDVLVLFSLKLLPLSLLFRTRRLQTCTVADIHDAPVGADRILSRFFLRFTDGTIAISRFVVDHLSVSGTRIVLRPISDSGRKVQSGALDPTVDVVLGVIGRVDPEKRIEVAIDAMGLLPPGFRLNIYGEPFMGDKSYVLSLKERVLPSAQVEFRGYVEPDDIYEEVDAVIICNEREPSGRTAGEAMLRSKVVFAPDRGGAQEYFEDSVTGFTYRALDATSLAQVLGAAFQPGRNLADLRRRARDKTSAERSPQAVAEKYFSALDSFIERRKRIRRY